MRVAIMQPYFAPYLGYFHLLKAADVFVLFDCVQFPRRGWVHRNQLLDRLGRAKWLTLPIVKSPRDARIHDLEIDIDRFSDFLGSWRRFPAFEVDHPLIQAYRRPNPMAVDYLQRTLTMTARALDICRPMIRSSEIDIDPALRGQDRVIAIARAVGAKHYVNASGGRNLYDAATFAHHGIQLEFLSPYPGARWSALQHILTGPQASLLQAMSPATSVERA